MISFIDGSSDEAPPDECLRLLLVVTDDVVADCGLVVDEGGLSSDELSVVLEAELSGL